MNPFTVVYDACVLYPAPLRDLLMSIALTDLYRAHWSNQTSETVPRWTALDLAALCLASPGCDIETRQAAVLVQHPAPQKRILLRQDMGHVDTDRDLPGECSCHVRRTASGSGTACQTRSAAGDPEAGASENLEQIFSCDQEAGGRI